MLSAADVDGRAGAIFTREGVGRKYPRCYLLAVIENTAGFATRDERLGDQDLAETLERV